ncbi:MAG: homocysteine S-methyltransferase family protein, partial [Chloroflexi bacterium]|nr:homocysteine S-methyltransferase family protein [Chloroflexota bacterium]
VIRTNTFQLNRRTYLNTFRDAAHRRRIGAPDLEQRAPMLLRRAVALAKAARERAGRPEVAIAGVISPLEHCFRPDLAPPEQQALAEHGELATILAEAGVDLVLLEAMNTIGEACGATAGALATGKPVWVSFAVGADGNVLSGESLADAARAVREIGAAAVLASAAPPEDVSRAVERLAAAGHTPFGAFAHVGKFDPPSWKFDFFPQFAMTETWPPERYAAEAGQWQARSARIVGGCCGTSPAHTRAVKAALAGTR